MKTTIELEEWFKETYDEELLILQSDSGIEDEGSFMAAFGGEAGSNVVTFTMRFVSKTERDQSIFEIAEDVRQHVANIPGIYNYNVDDSGGGLGGGDRKSTRLNSSHVANSYAVFCLKKQTQ